jgi:prepilin-type N-terminal cleavage/methylation domain-containing protein
MLKMLRKPSKGFTLVETLVVATIFSFIGLAIATSFMTGIKIWDRARNTDFLQYNNLLTLEMITKELRQALDYPLIGFEVKAGEFSFPTLIGDSVVKITYTFDSEKKALLRKQLDLKDIISNKEQENTKEKIVFNSLEEFSLSYFYHYFDKDQSREIYEWREVKGDLDTWTKGKGIPLAIKLQGKVKNELFSKTVFIPIS